MPVLSVTATTLHGRDVRHVHSDDCLYRADLLHSRGYMLEKAHSEYLVHDSKAMDSTDELVRIWHCKLRHNAAMRMQRWA